MSNKRNLLLDIGILLAFLALLEPALTGLAVHEWLGAAFAGTLIAHILLHWKWVIEVGRRYFQKLLHVSRLQLVIDLGLFAAFTTVTFSGLLISRSILPTLGLAAGENHVWRFLHSSSADLTLILTGVHLALNWRWLVTMTRRFIFSPIMALFAGLKPPAQVPAGAREEVQTD